MHAVGSRRVARLRRDELAEAAGVSSAYLKRLEQGRDQHPSESVLRALAASLRLDAAATAHLLELGGHLPGPSGGERVEEASRSLTRMLERHVDAPAFIVGRTLDVLAANDLARRLHPSFQPGRSVLRDAFLDERAAAGYDRPERVRDELVASLQANATGPGGEVEVLAAELAEISEAFAARWRRRDVRHKADGTKDFAHPELGRLALHYDTLSVDGRGHQRLIVYSAEPHTAEARALATLAARTPRPGALRVVRDAVAG